MIIRQEESSPIGNYFHDNRLLSEFEKIENTVDEFDVDTDDLNFHIDELISKLKGLKAHTKKVEDAWIKHLKRLED